MQVIVTSLPHPPKDLSSSTNRDVVEAGDLPPSTWKDCMDSALLLSFALSLCILSPSLFSLHALVLGQNYRCDPKQKGGSNLKDLGTQAFHKAHWAVSQSKDWLVPVWPAMLEREEGTLTTKWGLGWGMGGNVTSKSLLWAAHTGSTEGPLPGKNDTSRC